jgi:hypothetical protein
VTAVANSLNVDLTGRLVLLREDAMRPEFRARDERLFRVSGGFGAVPYTIGTALFGTFVKDGTADRMDGYDVEALVDEGGEHDGTTGGDADAD